MIYEVIPEHIKTIIVDDDKYVLTCPSELKYVRQIYSIPGERR